MEDEKKEKFAEIAIKCAFRAGMEIMSIYSGLDFGVEVKKDKSPLTLADKAAHTIIVEALMATGLPIISEEGEIPDFSFRKNWKYCWMVDPLDGTKEFIKRNGQFTVNIALIEDGSPVFGVVYAPVLHSMYFSIQNKAFVLDEIDLNFNSDEFWDFLSKNKKPLPLGLKRNKYVILTSLSHQDPRTENYIENLKSEHQNFEVKNVGSSLKFCMIASGKADIYPRFSKINEWDTAAGHAIIEQAGGSMLEAISGLPIKYNKETLKNPWFIARL